MNTEYLDEDGYPTEEALDKVSNWSYEDPKGWFEFIGSLWNMKGWGWNESEQPHEWIDNKTVLRYNISTGGWSGNESIIEYMKENHILWSTTWVQSKRGGHYIFEITKDEV